MHGHEPTRPGGPNMKWAGHRNLRLRPPAPAKGRGRLQRQVARACIAAGTPRHKKILLDTWWDKSLGAADLYRWQCNYPLR
jgi:hypothetical protein